MSSEGTMKTYPEWQKVIREAQRIEAEKKAQLEKERAEKDAEIERERGKNLMQVLALLGIDLDMSPQINHAKMGNYIFWLRTEILAGDGPMFAIAPARTNPGTNAIWFTLNVSKVPFPHHRTFELKRLFKTLIVTGGKPIDSDWTEERAELAAIFDEIDAHETAETERYNIWLKAKEQSESKVSPTTENEPSTEEKLTIMLRELIREIVTSEVADALGYK